MLDRCTWWNGKGNVSNDILTVTSQSSLKFVKPTSSCRFLAEKIDMKYFHQQY